jgi:hypothetical protein
VAIRPGLVLGRLGLGVSVMATVLNERIDRFSRGGRPFELGVAGLFEFDRDGRIVRWRDYYDLKELTDQLEAAGLAQRHRARRDRTEVRVPSAERLPGQGSDPALSGIIRPRVEGRDSRAERCRDGRIARGSPSWP